MTEEAILPFLTFNFRVNGQEGLAPANTLSDIDPECGDSPTVSVYI